MRVVMQYAKALYAMFVRAQLLEFSKFLSRTVLATQCFYILRSLSRFSILPTKYQADTFYVLHIYRKKHENARCNKKQRHDSLIQ